MKQVLVKITDDKKRMFKTALINNDLTSFAFLEGCIDSLIDGDCPALISRGKQAELRRKMDDRRCNGHLKENL